MRSLALILSLTMPLSGCGIIEPSSKSSFDTKAGTPPEVVFACTEATIQILKMQRGTWSDLVTTRNTDSGLFETNRFNELNIVGIRTQIKYAPETGRGRIRVKASGPYFTDLGADQAVAELANGITACL